MDKPFYNSFSMLGIPRLVHSDVLSGILIFLRIPIERAPVMTVMLLLARVAIPAGNVRAHVRTLRLNASGDRVAGASDDLAGLSDITSRARKVRRVVGGHSGRGLGDTFIIEEVVLGALVRPGNGGNGTHYACVVGDRGAGCRHLAQAAALVRVLLLTGHFGGCRCEV